MVCVTLHPSRARPSCNEASVMPQRIIRYAATEHPLLCHGLSVMQPQTVSDVLSDAQRVCNEASVVSSLTVGDNVAALKPTLHLGFPLWIAIKFCLDFS